MMENDLYWYWLTNIPTIGRKTIKYLLDRYDTPKDIYQIKDKEMEILLNNQKKIAAWKNSKNFKDIQKNYLNLKSQNVQFIHINSYNYPHNLKMIPDPPYGLYLKGNLPEQNTKSIAIIGTRNCTRYGSEIARYFARELAKNNVSIISGLARGIDGMAHRGALDTNGYTLGVIGGGIDQIYPYENYNLYKEMEYKGGIISESNIGVKPSPGLFPQRNRLIAGLSDGILVVEAMEKSGTFITVDQGLDQGKDIFSIPGRILDEKSKGCNHLIKLGAYIVTEVSDILEVLQITKNNNINNQDSFNLNNKINKISLAPHEKMVYSCLQIEPKYFDDIIKEVKFSSCEVYSILYNLILRGMITETTQNYYAIKL